MRNPIINGTLFIGDPHLGRIFVNNVHLDKRGLLEANQRKVFTDLLNEAKAQLLKRIVVVGDVFDKYVVKEEVIHWLLNTLHDFVTTTRGLIPIYMIEGNHDSSKNSSVKSSFDLLDIWAMTAHPQSIHIVRSIQLVDDLMLIPWRHDKTAMEQVNSIKDQFVIPAVAVTHLDRVSYGNDRNVIPGAELQDLGVQMIINGHEHKPVVSGIVHCIGSMLPYSHAEVTDSESNYITLTQEQIEAPDFDPTAYANAMVRVVVEKGFELPEILSIGVQVVRQDSTVSIDKLNGDYVAESLQNLFQLSMEEAGVEPELIQEVWAVLESFKQSDN